MKSYIIYAFIVALLLMSCDDLSILQEKPKAIATETFLNTKDEIEGTIYSVYFQLRSFPCFGRQLFTVSECMTDYGYGRGSYAYPSDFKGLDATNSNRIQDTWATLYHAINFANKVIKNAPNAANATQDEIIPLIAEARFLRAFTYYRLVEAWGDVPLFTEKNMSEFSKPRTSVTTIFDFIVDDLKYAEANLPVTQNMMGRPQQTTAKTILTEVYLAMKRWSDARTKALEVINSNKYSLVKVKKPDDFYNIFGPNVNRSSEEIFYMKYNRQTAIASGVDWVWMMHSPKAPYMNYKGAGGVPYSDSITNKVIREWDFRDLRKKFNLYSSDFGFGPTTVLCKKFIDSDATSNSAMDDVPLYRYADLLLFYAEAECMANNGPTTEGMEKLNMVHRRAYGYDPLIASIVDFKASNYNKETFIDLILKERCYETMFEGKRYNDLKRMSKLGKVIFDTKGIVVSEAALLWPIPAREIQYNDSIDENDQNPGY